MGTEDGRHLAAPFILSDFVMEWLLPIRSAKLSSFSDKTIRKQVIMKRPAIARYAIVVIMFKFVLRKF